MRIAVVVSVLLMAVVAHSQSIVTPLFVHKDGEASQSSYAGSEKDILVDGGAQGVVGWITFQTEGVAVSQISSAKLTLYVKEVKTPGTLKIYPLTQALGATENSVTLGSIPLASSAAMQLNLGSQDVEKMVQLDVTSLLKSEQGFYGVALKSDNGLVAGFDSKEGRLAPVILLTHDVQSAAAKWHSGSNDPQATLGKDGDYYLQTSSGMVWAKGSGAWVSSANLKGATGATGPQGAAGATGTPGAAGVNGHSPVTTSSTSLAIATNQEVTLTFATNRNGFGVGQRIRIASTATPANWMEGAIVAYNATSGEARVALDNHGGSGTYAAWTVSVAGTPGRRDLSGIVVDYDGNAYRTVKIGTQEWTMTNLRTTHYRDGTPIPFVPRDQDWAALSSGAWCVHPCYAEAIESHGLHYNWYAVDNPSGLAPEGWRVPSTADWDTLEAYLIRNGYNFDKTTTENRIAKSLAAGLWDTTTFFDGSVGNKLHLNNSSGFSGLPGIYRGNYGIFPEITPANSGYWWSATAKSDTEASYRFFHNTSVRIHSGNTNKKNGYGVRVLRDLK